MNQQLAPMAESITATEAIVWKLLRQEVATQRELLQFPLDSTDKVQEFEEALNEPNRVHHLTIHKRILPADQFEKNFHKFIGENIINTYNYDGSHVSFKVFKKITEKLEELLVGKDAEKTIRNGFCLSKQKLNKRAYDQRKKQ